MEKLLLGISPVQQALLAGCFTWAVTALGAGAVFVFPHVGRATMDALLGFASGVMIAASYWSLLAPSIEMSRGLGIPVWLPPAVGFLAGAGVLRTLDWILPPPPLIFATERSGGNQDQLAANIPVGLGDYSA